MYRTNKEVNRVNLYFTDNKNKFNKEIGKTIKRIRNSKNIAIEDISERANITPTYFSHIEKGLYGISLLKFICICNSLEISPNELLEEFLYGSKFNEDILYNCLQNEKNISENILIFLKKKK